MPEADFVDQARVAKSLAAIDLAGLGLRPLRVALVAACTLDHFASVFRLWLAEVGFAAAFFILPFDTVAASVLDPASDLYSWKPDLVWLFATHRDVSLSVPPGAADAEIAAVVTEAVAARQCLWRAVQERLGCLVMDNTADIPAADPFGNFAGVAPWGRRSLLHRYNLALGAAAPAGVVIFDLDHVAGLWGKHRWDDARYWFHSRHAFALDASGMVAHAAARLVAGARGIAKKCIVLDLDNTLWGGVIGDDGLAGIRLGAGAEGEAFLAFQVFLRGLNERGIILAVCSKNDPDVARLPFQQHPDIALRLEHFAAFVANWENKADNIRAIAAALAIGLDAIVFVDDNPLERDIVRQHLPQVTVIDLPADPSGFVSALARGAWFEATSFSREDQTRGRYYAENAERQALQSAYVNMDSYLEGLHMLGTVGVADTFSLPRMAQLIGKSNQFHLTGTRYGESELAALAARPDWRLHHLRLSDRFGDNGLIACLLLRIEGATLHIDTWVMSCRVLGRTVEEYIANVILAVACEHACRQITGRYIRSARNGMVAGLYERLGFACAERTATIAIWTLAVDRTRSGWKTWVRHASSDDGSQRA
jgi:FkbH-like protein